jgi:outer membrane protein, heavy metal efflux system
LKASHHFLIATLLLMAGCQSYQPQPLDPRVTASAFGSRRLDDPQVRSALAASGVAFRRWPPQPWQLRQLQAAALHFHPEIAVARASAAAANGAITTADTAPNPMLAFLPEIGNAKSATSPWLFGFTLDVTVETANKRGERTAQARATRNAAALAIADKAWTVAAGVRAALLDLTTATERLNLLESQRANDAAIVQMAATRLGAGETPRSELSLYQTQQNRDLIDLADGRSKLESARAKIAVALSVPLSSIRSTALSFGALERFPNLPSEKSLRRAALIRRSDVLAALQTYAASDAALRLEIAKQTPDFHLNPGYNFDQGQSKWALGVGLTLPIDRNAGPIREAIAKRAEAAAVFERLQIGIRGELDQAQNAHRADRQRLRELENLLASQLAQLADAERLTQAGDGNLLAAHAARASVIQARLGRLEALAQAQQSLGQLQDSAHLSFDEN